MRQLSCMSADVYCQITNNHFYATPSFYTQTEIRGKLQAAGETERESVRETESCLKTELPSVVKMVVGRRMNYFEISGNSKVWITFS
jgi:hypothetical protein